MNICVIDHFRGNDFAKKILTIIIGKLYNEIRILIYKKWRVTKMENVMGNKGYQISYFICDPQRIVNR